MSNKKVPKSPYRGILPFHYVDRDYFYGRKDVVDQLRAKVLRSRLIILFGESGSGKSSLINAGLVPALIKEGFSSECLRLRPIPDEPILIKRIQAESEDASLFLPSIFADEKNIKTDIKQTFSCSLEGFISNIRTHIPEIYPALIFDQFEELFTLFQEQQPLQNKLLELIFQIISDENLRVKTIIVVREDFLGKLEILAKNYPRTFDHRVRLEYLDKQNAIQAIIGPFENDNPFPSRLTQDLAEKIFQNLSFEQPNNTANPTHLQIVCSRLWGNYATTKSEITVNEFKKLGEVKGILEGFLNSELAGLDPDVRNRAIRILGDLITESGTRDVVSEDKLKKIPELVPSGKKRWAAIRDLSSTLFFLAERRIINRTVQRNTPYYEVASEYLIPCIQKELQQLEQQQQQQELERERQEAEEQRRQVEKANKLTKELQFMLSNLLSAQSKILQENCPQYSLLLAIQALNITTEMGEPRIPFAEEALREAFTNTGGWGLSGHQDIITCVAISSDNRWLVTGSKDTTARLWDLTNPIAPPIILCGHGALITAVAISSDNHWLVSGSQDNTARLWDLTDPNAPPCILRGHTYFIHAIAISPDNHWIITVSGDYTARLWDLKDLNAPSIQSIILSGHGSAIRALAVSSDSHWLVTGSDDHTARLWDLTTSDPNTTSFVLSGHSDSIWNVAISSNNQWIVTAGLANDKTVRLWDLNNLYAPPRILTGHDEGISTFAISLDNHWLVTGSWDKTVRLWNLWDLPNLNSSSHVLRGHEDWISGVAISANNHYLVTVSGDKSVRFWDLSNLDATPLFMHGHEHIIGTVAISPDKHWLVTGSHDRTARLWNLDTPITEPVILRDVHSPIAISQDNLWLAAACKDNNLQLRNLKDLTARPITLNAGREQITAITISPDSHWLVVCSVGNESNTAQLWDLTTLEFGNKPFLLRGHDWGIRAVAFSADSRWLVTGSDDCTARLWDLTATDPNANPSVLSGHTDSVCAVAISPNGQWLATGGRDRIAFLWEFTNPPVKRFILKGHEHPITAIAISHDNLCLATGSEDKTVRLWDLTANDPSLLNVLSGHIWGIRSIAISTDNRWLVTGSDDKTARLWDLTNRSAASIVLRGHNAPVWAVAISSDNHWLVTASTDNVRLWNLRLDELVDIACRTVGRNMTLEEWKKYFSSQKYRKICPNLPVLHSVIKEMFERAQSLSQQGNAEAASSIYEQAVQWAIEAGDMDLVSH